MTNTPLQKTERLMSLDFYRGITMFLLIAEFTHLFGYLVAPELKGTFIYDIGMQFHHVKWEGLHFWDLIQPFFMFIVGVAIPFSYANRMKKGASYKEIRNHAFKRALLLLFLGWWLYCQGPGKIVFRFQNVLAQLSVTYLIAFLIMRRSAVFQIVVSVGLILLTEIIYRTFPVEGFDQPWVNGHNFGYWLNAKISGQEYNSSWAIFNAIPTTAHTIWGVLAGQLLMSKRTDMQKVRILVIAGVIGLAIGYGFSGVTPIIKRIATSTFVFASGGWAFLALAFSYWLIDIKKFQKGIWIFIVVGMNPLFIYLFAHIGGADMVKEVVAPLTNTLLGGYELLSHIVLSLITLYLLWYICYWMFKKKIFIKI
jgi:predicted acyltransferase